MESASLGANQTVSYAKAPMLYFNIFIERFFYYGFRAFLVLFLVESVESGGAGMSHQDALTLYAAFTMIVYLSPLAGGLLADFWIPRHKVAAVGAVLFAVGCMLAIYLPPELVALGILLSAFGSGLFKPAIISMCAQHSAGVGVKPDRTFTGYEFLINLGAFAAPMALVGIMEAWNYQGLFITIAMIALCTAASVYFTVNKDFEFAVENSTEDASVNSSKRGQLLVAGLLVLSLVYWLVYDGMSALKDQATVAAVTFETTPSFLLNLFAFESQAQFAENIGLMNQYWQVFSVVLLLVGYLLCLILWSFIHIHSGFKLASALIFYAVAWLIVGYILDAGTEPSILTWLITAEVMFVLADLLFSPILMSMIAQYGPKKLWTSCFALYGVVVLITQKLNIALGDFHASAIVWVSISAFVMAVTIIIGMKKQKIG